MTAATAFVALSIPIEMPRMTVAEAVSLPKDLLHSWFAPSKSEKVLKTVAATAKTNGITLAIGDQLKITFFENMDVDESSGGTTGGEPSGNLKTFYQRMDLSGDYSIQQDGTLSLPRLGTLAVAGRNLQELQSELAALFEREMGHSASVSVIVSGRPPVYVVGPVRNPGSFAYIPGMIVLQAVALAGGIDSHLENAPQVIDGIREIERFYKTHERLQRLFARRARRVAERDNQPTLSPYERLLTLVDPERARQLL
jgi:protein involved in polysaccharide export with SLBB domain